MTAFALVDGQPRLLVVDPGRLPRAVTPGGLLYGTARTAVDDAATYREADEPEPVLVAAAQLLAGWWSLAAGYGLSRELLAAQAELPLAALDAVAQAHRDRQ